jgi:hypothetical protein
MEVAVKPFVLLVLTAAVLTSPVGAQDPGTTADSAVPAATHLYRNPHRALIIGSVIPGAGHIYAGEYWRGFLNYEFTVMTLGAGVMVFIVDKCTFTFLSTERCNPGPQWPHQVLGVATVGVGFWQWVSSARDALHAAERANEKHRRKMARVKPIIGAPVGSHENWRAGIEIPW